MRTEEPDLPLTEQQLADVRNNYAMLSDGGLQKAYMEALDRCRLDQRGRPPLTVHVQVFIQAWKVLRKHSSP